MLKALFGSSCVDCYCWMAGWASRVHREQAREGIRPVTVEKDCRKRLWAFLPRTVILGVVLALLWATSAHAASPASIVFRGSADRKWIALTFDDNTASAPSLATLEVLREYDVPATLFLIGYAVDGFPDFTNDIFQGVASGLF